MNTKLRYVVALSIAIVGVLLPTSFANACSCAFRSQDGFVPQTGRGGTVQEATLLPANAKGVLFFRGAPGWGGRDKPSPLKASNFSFRDETSGKEIKAALKILSREEKSLLVRIEPVGGFTPSHTYLVTYNATPHPGNSSVKIQIDSEPLAGDLMSSVTLVADGAVETKLLEIPAGGSCDTTVVANTQRLAFNLPPPLQRYRNSLLYFVTAKTAVEKDFSPWRYTSSLCSQPGYGRGELPPGNELIYADCGGRGAGLEAEGGTYTVAGKVGFLQVEDSFRTPAPIKVTFTSLTETQCSTVEHLKTIKDSAAKLESQLCQIGNSGASASSNEAADLAKFAAQYLADSRPQLRKCAAQALAGVPYALENALPGEIASLFNDTIIPLLAKLAGEDPDLETRKAAVVALQNTAHVGGYPGRGLKFSAAVEGLSKATLAQDKELSSSAANVLSFLKAEGIAASDTLRAVLADPARANYRAPTALAAVDPQNPLTKSALLAALNHTDGIVRSTAAAALEEIRANDVETVNALLASAKADNSDAIQALGKLGPVAAPALPVLKDLARNSKWSHIIQSSMLALAQIAPEDPETTAIIGAQLKWKENEFTRQKALEALGIVGPPAKSVVPRMLETLKEKPTDSEVLALINAFKAIKPDPKQVATPLRAFKAKEEWANEQVAEYLKSIS